MIHKRNEDEFAAIIGYEYVRLKEIKKFKVMREFFGSRFETLMMVSRLFYILEKSQGFVEAKYSRFGITAMKER